MNRPGAEQAHATIHDVSTYFSEEEWRLLQDWQKELYSNVMKEIHQALLSLGPLITASICKAKEMEEHWALDTEQHEGRHRVTRAPIATVDDSEDLRMNKREALHMNNLQESEGLGREERLSSDKSSSLSTGFPFLNTEICQRKEEPVPVSIDAFSAGVGGSGADCRPGFEVVSFHIKDEAETYFMEQQESSPRTVAMNPPSDESMKRFKVGDSFKYSEKSMPCKALSGINNTCVLQSSNNKVNSKAQGWSENYQPLRGDTTIKCESNFSNPVHFNLHQRSPNTEVSDAYNKAERTPKNSQFHKGLLNTQQHQSAYTCNEGEKGQRLKGTPTRHLRVSVRARPFACTECEKSFIYKSHLITHHRIHSGEKPYMCTFCHKRFNRKDYLEEHTRIHTGERPYKCTKCEKSFIQKHHLNEHVRKHT